MYQLSFNIQCILHIQHPIMPDDNFIYDFKPLVMYTLICILDFNNSTSTGHTVYLRTFLINSLKMAF
jgi:hypothetical protein